MGQYHLLLISSIAATPSLTLTLFRKMSSYLVTGCSRGLGLELVKELCVAPASAVNKVIATSRSPSAALDEIIGSHSSRFQYVQLDVTNEDSIQQAVQHAAQILDGRGLDVLINNAGIQGLEKKGMPALQTILETNIIAVERVTRAFLPLLQKGSDKKVVNVSSTLGSMAFNDFTKTMPFPSYKISKAALNMLTIQQANELESQGFTVFCVSPGWLQTDLGGQSADLAPDVGAKATLNVIYSTTPNDNGAFRNIHIENNPMYDGTNPPW